MKNIQKNSEKCKKFIIEKSLKSFLNHAGLYAGLVAYTAIGAGVSDIHNI